MVPGSGSFPGFGRLLFGMIVVGVCRVGVMDRGRVRHDAYTVGRVESVRRTGRQGYV